LAVDPTSAPGRQRRHMCVVRIQLEVEAVPGDRAVVVRSRPDDDSGHPDVIEQPGPLLDLQALNRESLRPRLPNRPGLAGVQQGPGTGGARAPRVPVFQAPRPGASSIQSPTPATAAASDIPMWPAGAPFRSSFGASRQSARPSTASAPTPGSWRLCTTG